MLWLHFDFKTFGLASDAIQVTTYFFSGQKREKTFFKTRTGMFCSGRVAKCLQIYLSKKIGTLG